MSPSYLPLTLTTDAVIDPAAPRSQRMTDEQAQALSDASVVYATEVFDLGLIEGGGMTWHMHPTLGGEPIDYDNDNVRLFVNCGDGVAAYATQPEPEYTYARPGSYLVSARLERSGLPSLERHTLVTATEEAPDE
jgi:hypothetical protein